MKRSASSLVHDDGTTAKRARSGESYTPAAVESSTSAQLVDDVCKLVNLNACNRLVSKLDVMRILTTTKQHADSLRSLLSLTAGWSADETEQLAEATIAQLGEAYICVLADMLKHLCLAAYPLVQPWLEALARSLAAQHMHVRLMGAPFGDGAVDLTMQPVPTLLVQAGCVHDTEALCYLGPCVESALGDAASMEAACAQALMSFAGPLVLVVAGDACLAAAEFALRIDASPRLSALAALVMINAPPAVCAVDWGALARPCAFVQPYATPGAGRSVDLAGDVCAAERLAALPGAALRRVIVVSEADAQLRRTAHWQRRHGLSQRDGMGRVLLALRLFLGECASVQHSASAK